MTPETHTVFKVYLRYILVHLKILIVITHHYSSRAAYHYPITSFFAL